MVTSALVLLPRFVKSSLQAVAALFVLSSASVGTASAVDAVDANPYDIKKVEKVSKYIAWVDNAWKSNTPVVQAEIRVRRELTDEKPFARAYFYDRASKLLEKFDKPVSSSDDRKDYTTIPGFFKPREVYKVCFPIREKYTQPGEKWARVIVVFGDANSVVAECYPKDDLAKFDFAEKELALKSAAKPGTGSGLTR